MKNRQELNVCELLYVARRKKRTKSKMLHPKRINCVNDLMAPFESKGDVMCACVCVCIVCLYIGKLNAFEFSSSPPLLCFPFRYAIYLLVSMFFSLFSLGFIHISMNPNYYAIFNVPYFILIHMLFLHFDRLWNNGHKEMGSTQSTAYNGLNTMKLITI